MFCFSFGGVAETVDAFDAMYSAAKKAGGENIQLYSHNWIPDDRGVLMPRAKKTASVVMMLSAASDSQWTPGRMADYFTPFHVAEPAVALLRPAWRVTLGGGHGSPANLGTPTNSPKSAPQGLS